VQSTNQKSNKISEDQHFYFTRGRRITSHIEEAQKLLTLYGDFTFKNGRAGKSGSSSLTSLIGGAWPLRRYSLKTKPDKTIKIKDKLSIIQ
jgi:hypothetical protein